MMDRRTGQRVTPRVRGFPVAEVVECAVRSATACARSLKASMLPI